MPYYPPNTAPTVQKFLSTGSQTGILITQANTTVTATAGAVYTNNSNNYTLLNTIASSAGPLFFSGSGSISGSTFTKSSGTGPTTIVWSNSAFEQTMGTYTVPTSPAPLYIRVITAGGGGGGGGSGTTTTGGTGTVGGASVFGTNILVANGGGGGSNTDSGGNGSGGNAIINSPAIGLALVGGMGSSGVGGISTLGFFAGGDGGSNPFGGYGVSIISSNAANGIANTGGGGGGAATGTIAGFTGNGGGAGGYINAIITSPSGTYFYSVAPGGPPGSAGTSGFQGGTGATGLVLVEEFYQ